MTKGRRILLIAATAVAANAALAAPALAIGCNGVVNPMLPRCSRSDDNDGPGFPYFRPQRVAIPEKAGRIEMKQGTPMVQHQGKWLPVSSSGQGNIIAISDGN